MKKLILSALLITGVAAAAGAQTTGNQGSGTNHISNSGSSNSTTTTSTATSTTNSGGHRKTATKGRKKTVNERRIYTSKATGQAATPTGQEATGVNASNSNNPKNAGKSEQQ